MGRLSNLCPDRMEYTNISKKEVEERWRTLENILSCNGLMIMMIM